MEQVIARLHSQVYDVPHAFRLLSEEEVSRKPGLEKWSPKEILGHLCDSAVNNLGRFVRAQTEQTYRLIGYEQNQWVKALAYQTRPAEEILQLWVGLNLSIISVMTSMPKDFYQNACELADGSVVTLQWLMTDYVDHMEHHLGQIWPKSDRQ
jgi:hypothetical protein